MSGCLIVWLLLQVTFCKRKGGLFKKADDLSKLCGVEVAVIIVADKKSCEYASTDMNRILERYREMQAGGTGEDTSENSRLWEQLETQRRELEALTRELAAEVSCVYEYCFLSLTMRHSCSSHHPSQKRQVEELRGSHPHAIEMGETQQAPLLPVVSLMQSAAAAAAPTSGSILRKPSTLPKVHQKNNPRPQFHELLSTVLEAAPAPSSKHDRTYAISELSDDTAEVDSASEGTCMEEPTSKRMRIDSEESEKVIIEHSSIPNAHVGLESAMSQLAGAHAVTELVN